MSLSLKPLNVEDIANHYFGTIAQVYNENKKENNDDDDDDDEILEGVLSSFFLGSLIGLFFGGIIGYYKDNFLLGLLLSITLT